MKADEKILELERQKDMQEIEALQKEAETLLSTSTPKEESSS